MILSWYPGKEGMRQSCPRVGWTRGSGRVGSRFCRILAGRVGSGQHFGFFSFLLIISWYLNRCESSNTTLGLIDIWYNNLLIIKYNYSIENYTYWERVGLRVASGRVRLFVSNRGSGRVNVSAGRVGSGPRKVTRGQLWYETEGGKKERSWGRDEKNIWSP